MDTPAFGSSACVCTTVGVLVAWAMLLGVLVAEAVGALLGFELGAELGLILGEGEVEGEMDGLALGLVDGEAEGDTNVITASVHFTKTFSGAFWEARESSGAVVSALYIR